ncbi:MAG TPA: alpha/beta hydrolase [Chloroflexota bacterium]|nr:alpha/beta hydrolase [Chloroflexota bacterium]
MPAERSILVGGRQTRIAEAGAGRPLMLLHDTYGNRWTHGHTNLSARFKVIAPTMPGFEHSDELKGIDGPEDVVFWLLDLLAELQLNRPILAGGGLGGWMAAEFAVRYPERIGALVVIDAYGLQVGGALAADEFALPGPQLRPLLFADPAGQTAQEWLPDQEPMDRVEHTLRARVAAARLAWQFPYSPKLRGRLSRVTVPAYVAWGEHDSLVPLAHAHAWAEGLPNAQLHVASGAGHYPYLDDPTGFASRLADFGRTVPR